MCAIRFLNQERHLVQGVLEAEPESELATFLQGTGNQLGAPTMPSSAEPRVFTHDTYEPQMDCRAAQRRGAPRLSGRRCARLPAALHGGIGRSSIPADWWKYLAVYGTSLTTSQLAAMSSLPPPPLQRSAAAPPFRVSLPA